ncbi:MAG: transposase, partial [Mangrovibacterium sp.]
TNKDAKGKKGALVAMIKGTSADDVIKVLMNIPRSKRRRVKEITLDMAGAMNKIASRSFPCAQLVTDRFHVQKLALDALQNIRIELRWEALDKENNDIANARQSGKPYKPMILANGDTIKQLLARSRYLLFKSREKWTDSQKQRADLLFDLYPTLKEAYGLVNDLRVIYNSTIDKGVAMTKLARWYNKVTDSGFSKFNTVTATIYLHYRTILNYFENRSTNASAESFNAKIKDFRRKLRGVADVKYFLFRLSKIYA